MYIIVYILPQAPQKIQKLTIVFAKIFIIYYIIDK